ncbi:Predicted phosphoribosyltransferase [Methanosarcina thermophila]|jgi:putative phosphoribosyl transferase|uniref:Phosphoribosyltransferase n=3 Tax=Methanosarcina thermophila TaxID=2210 RepID=A0A1I6Z3Y8_METTE|nr:phosphoribosyltransferase [Methanosarcina thermophila]ALK06360.1 MAG: phosphoribosyltransferase [Methanosarcina sp. 795]AKB12012.1 phosphoribosyltransferase [Methanosarcina thermophila TM-1]AKB14795.1 phosphoribosyltransferase [Methanosarcina thermophila CHTI-55]NLU56412.1 phosphoribosyltransferase [Methanosarcina thermophila]SFT57374.1 Predicted phosphoribosyltransferase [Methanosarcina thermophila]
MFKNRKDAGEKLAKALEKYREENPVILAIPRGGVEVGLQVAAKLNAEFSLIIARKLPFPDNPEAGFGAIAEDGSTFILEDAYYWLEGVTIERIKQQQIAEIERRIKTLRGGKPLPEIKGRTVILIDDGIAMGSTMRAAIELCRNREAGKVVVAVPVAGREVAKELQKKVDDLIVLETPAYFRAVAQVYERWYDVSDEEVLDLLRERIREKELKDQEFHELEA